jgi:uncharacterized protein
MSEITYFEKTGPENTDATLSLAAKRSVELSIRDVIIASSSGTTGLTAAQTFKNNNLIIVTHSTGFEKKDFQELVPKRRTDLEKLGCTVLTCQHAFGGVNRGIRRMLHTYQTDEIIAYTLRTMGQGFKVCVEMALMASDAGLVSTQKQAICIGGTGTGADCAVVLTPANSQNFFELKVHEIICKPRM